MRRVAARGQDRLYRAWPRKADSVEVRVTKDTDLPAALAKLRELSQPLGGLLGSSGQRSLEVSDAGGGLIRLTVPPAAITERIRQTVEQSIQIVERRVNELGTVEPLIQRQGTDRILVQVPGLQDPTRLKEMLGKTAKMDFRMVDTTVPPEQAHAGPGAAGFRSADELRHAEDPPYVVKKQVLVSGGDLTDAPARLRPALGRADRQLPLQYRGLAQIRAGDLGECRAALRDRARQRGDLGAGDPRADHRRLAARFPATSPCRPANDLAILLRAGALPAPLTIIEERTVGPGLGQDSIEKGELAAYVGSIMVIVFMLLTYRLFGVFANIAVAINVAMIFGVLSLLNATLTLPGIAGIVLTVGIAVDSNVLIYERIREELRGGRTAISAIDAGFKRALSTILDSNITTFIAAAVLFYIGTGPVRGFAVTLGIGIITTVFTAFTLTRLIVAGWVRWKRPQSVPI